MYADEPTPVEEQFVAPRRAATVPCRNHDERPAETLCQRCGDFVCGLCAIPLQGIDYCPSCVVKVRGDVMTLGKYIPWEDRARLGFTKAALQTIQAAFMRPREFFDRMPMEGGVAEPLLFGMLMRAIYLVAYGLVFSGFYLILAAATREPMMVFQAAIQLGGILFNIFAAGAMLFIVAGMLHLGVLMVGGTRGYEATFRVFAYSRAVDVLDLIPILGPFASMGLRVYLNYLGMQAAHEIKPVHALLIAISPILVFLFIMMLFVGLAIVFVLLVASI